MLENTGDIGLASDGHPRSPPAPQRIAVRRDPQLRLQRVPVRPQGCWAENLPWIVNAARAWSETARRLSTNPDPKNWKRAAADIPPWSQKTLQRQDAPPQPSCTTGTAQFREKVDVAEQPPAFHSARYSAYGFYASRQWRCSAHRQAAECPLWVKSGHRGRLE